VAEPSRPPRTGLVAALFSRLGALFLLGVASGLPFDLVSGTGTLQLWLSSSGVDITTIGMFGLVSIPYTLKPLWSPLLDRYAPPGLSRFGRRRGWMIIALVAMTLGVCAMALFDPKVDPELLAVAALFVAFFSASFDIVVDGYRTELLPPAERGIGAALASAGYRTGMLVAGALTPLIALALLWSGAYAVMAGILLLGLLAAIASPAERPMVGPRPTLSEAFVRPLVALFTRKHALALLAIVFFYKLGDSFGSAQYNTFLNQGLGFQPAEIGAIRKAVGVPAILGGMFIGGVLMVRMRLFTALLVFGTLQALTNVLLVLQAASGQSYDLLVVVLAFENFAGGLGNVAFVTLITALCDRRYAATHFALMSSLAQLGRLVGGPISGPTQLAVGWQGYFWISTVVALPGLVWLVIARKSVLTLDLDPSASGEEARG